MITLPAVEMGSGLIALILTAMAFTHLSWAEGASEPTLRAKSRLVARRLFLWAGAFWAVCFACAYLCMH